MSLAENPFGNRTNNYDFTKDYWHILSAQLFFVIAFLVSVLDFRILYTYVHRQPATLYIFLYFL